MFKLLSCTLTLIAIKLRINTVVTAYVKGTFIFLQTHFKYGE